MDLIHLLVSLVILCLVLSILWYIVGLLPIAPPFRPIITIVFWLIVLLAILRMFTPFIGPAWAYH